MTTILTLNLIKSKLENSLTEVFKSSSEINYYCLDNLDSLDSFGKDIYLKPDSIFIFFDDNCRIVNNEKIERINRHFPYIPVIGVLENSNICIDFETLRKFVWQFFIYPFRKDEILLTINWYSQKHYHSGHGIDNIYSSLKKHAAFDLFKGESRKSIEIKEKINKIAQFDVTVLINGETGTGKELCAKMIHFLSNRADKAFIPVNCGAVPSELFENELFGHKKGAYTNAESSENGLITEANNGTLFLDEIESLPELMQVKILRFLEDKKYKPLGQSQYITSDVRIIAAAKEDLTDRVKKNLFREDLFYRLNIVNINLPPLHERQEDIPVLVSFFIERFSKLFNKEIEGIEPIALMKMMHYGWEGNIRELQNTVQQAVIMNSTGIINEEDLNMQIENTDVFHPFGTFKSAKQFSVSNFENSYLSNLMSLFNGNLTKAARFARKDRRALSRLLKKHKINPSFYRKSSNNM